MKTLHLNLHRKWVDMTKSGAKKEEYRDHNNSYWIKRIVDKDLFKFSEDFNNWIVNMAKDIIPNHVLNISEVVFAFPLHR